MISSPCVGSYGYAQITLKLTPKRKISVAKLALELPLCNEQVKLVRDNRAIGGVRILVPMVWKPRILYIRWKRLR